MTGTEQLRLRYVLSPREETDRIDLPVLSVYRDHGVVTKDSRTDNYNKTPEDLSRYQRVAIGDLVVNKMKAWSGSIAVSRYQGIVSPDYLVCRVNDRVLPNFLHHVVRSVPFVAGMRSWSKGIRPSQERLYWDDLADMEVSIPPLSDQRQIADFLDDQVTLLDHAVDLRQSQIALLEERFKAELDRAVAPPGATDCRLKHLCQGPGQYGFNIPASEYVDKGVGMRLIRTTDLHSGRLTDETDGIYVLGPVEEKFLLHRGDVLVSRAGTVGRAFLVPKSAVGMTFAGFLVRFRPKPHVDPRFLAYSIQCPAVQGQVQEGAIVSTIQNFNAERYAELRVHSLDSEAQRHVADRLDAHRHEFERVTGHLTRSTTLLQERKQALISAAVTGQFDVTAARRVA